MNYKFLLDCFIGNEKIIFNIFNLGVYRDSNDG